MLRISTFFLTSLLFLAAHVAWAQPGDPGGDPDNPVPLSGIFYLLAAGAMLGAKKFNDIRKKKSP